MLLREPSLISYPASCYFTRQLPAKYLRHSRVSLPSSGWIGVVPLRHRHQEKPLNSQLIIFAPNSQVVKSFSFPYVYNYRYFFQKCQPPKKIFFSVPCFQFQEAIFPQLTNLKASTYKSSRYSWPKSLSSLPFSLNFTFSLKPFNNLWYC